MRILNPRFLHARPSARLPIDMSGNFSPHMSGGRGALTTPEHDLIKSEHNLMKFEYTLRSSRHHNEHALRSSSSSASTSTIKTKRPERKKEE